MACDAVNVEAAGSIPLGHPDCRVTNAHRHSLLQECAPGRAGGLQSRSTPFESVRSCFWPMWLEIERQRSCKPPDAGANPAVGSACSGGVADSIGLSEGPGPGSTPGQDNVAKKSCE